MAETLNLEGKLDVTAVESLHEQCLALKGQDVVLDLSKVTLMGALCLQVCVAAARQALATNHSFTVVNTPDAVLAQINAMGLTPETIAEGAI